MTITRDQDINSYVELALIMPPPPQKLVEYCPCLQSPGISGRKEDLFFAGHICKYLSPSRSQEFACIHTHSQ